MSNELKYAITPKMLYGMDPAELVPPEMEVVDFRPPIYGEEYLAIALGVSVACDRFEDYQPRLILRKKKRKKIVFTLSRRGMPKAGEWCTPPGYDRSPVLLRADIPIECDIYNQEIVEE
jgi:hypothetical protein